MNYNMRHYRKIQHCFLIGLILMIPAALMSQSEIPVAVPGEIIFSDRQITNENLGSDILKDTFNTTDRIYGRIFIEEPLADIFKDFGWEYDFYGALNNYNHSIDIYVDGKKMIQWLDEMPQTGFHNYTYFDLTILPERQLKYEHSMSVSDWLNVIDRLDPGMHEVSVKMRAMTPTKLGLGKEPLSVGSFQLSVTENGKNKVLNKYMIGMPEPTMVNQNIQEQVVEASEDIYPGLVPVRAVIVEPTGEWQFTEDRQGNVLNRFFTAAVAYEGFDDECYVRTAVYMQDHDGYGQFGEVILSRRLENMFNYQLPCKNLFK